MENPAISGAPSCQASRRDRTEYTRPSHDPQPLAGPRFERLVKRLHRLGPRPLAELLIEIAHRTGQSKFIADRLQAYAELDPAIVRALGADSFPQMPLGVVR